jgi:hypothetical protein
LAASIKVLEGSMRNFVVLTCCVISFLAFSGCKERGQNEIAKADRNKSQPKKRTPDELATELIRHANKATDAMSAVKDEAMAKEEKTKFRILSLKAEASLLHGEYMMRVAPGKEHDDFSSDVRKKIDEAWTRFQSEWARFDKLAKGAESEK